MGQKNWNQALRYLEDALLLKTASNDLSQLTVILNNIGQCHIALGNAEKAIQVFQQALEKALQNGQLRDALRSQTNLIRIHASKNDFETAFRLQQEKTALKDSLARIENSRTIQDLKIRYETQRKEDALNLLQKENAIVTNRWLTLALGLFFLLILGILIYDNQRRKHRQQTDLMTAEDELQKAELKIMTEVLEHNQQKLKLYTENLLKKNELVEELETKLQIGSDRVGDGNDKKVQKKIRSVRILTDDDWEEFKELFDGVHQGLLDRLLSNYEDLTLAEQRLFLLMKLSMSTKQIANILGVSPDSVKKGRYRLKKKLRIENDMTLQGFVDQFS
jgi:DNA-binding CsgD family transcriptional regulator/cbb3-type cytochrome oxidase subunit 3